MTDFRAEFEKWIGSPPIEKSVHRKAVDSQWPGQYDDYQVQLAWEAWCARAALAEDAVGPSEIPVWTEGVCGDGAALLRDGVMVPIEEVVAELNRGESARAALAEDLEFQQESLKQVKPLLQAIQDAYSGLGWVSDGDFVKLFEEVTRLAGIVEEGWDATLATGVTE